MIDMALTPASMAASTTPSILSSDTAKIACSTVSGKDAKSG